MASLLTSKPETERQSDQALRLDTKDPKRILEILLDGQSSAAPAVAVAIEAIESAARLAAAAIGSGNRLAYVGAGSSGLMAMADALELPGTYGIPRERIEILFAGGSSGLHDLTGTYDDDVALARADLESAALSDGDCAICVSASGTTPYTVEAEKILRDTGVATIALANNEGAPLLRHADAPVLLATPPEVISGSTRMGAGTAQKIALNMISTLMAIQLGHVHDGMMVNLVADNEKLRLRASQIVSAIAGCQTEQANSCLDEAEGSVKVAVLLASGVPGVTAARQMLADANGNLRAALGTN